MTYAYLLLDTTDNPGVFISDDHHPPAGGGVRKQVKWRVKMSYNMKQCIETFEVGQYIESDKPKLFSN